MKVAFFILVLVVLVLSILQFIVRIEVMRLRNKELAYDAQINVLQERVAEILLNYEAGLTDYNRLEKHLDGQIKTNAEVFAKVNERIDKLEERIPEVKVEPKKKTTKAKEGAVKKQ